MPALGLVLAWGGYWFLAYGLLYRQGLPVTLTDVALPSRRKALILQIQNNAPGLGAAESGGLKLTGPGTAVAPSGQPVIINGIG